MARFAPHPVRKVLGALTAAAQTLSLELDNVSGRRIAKIQVMFVITNPAGAKAVEEAALTPADEAPKTPEPPRE